MIILIAHRKFINTVNHELENANEIYDEKNAEAVKARLKNS